MNIESLPHSTAHIKRPNSYWSFTAEDYDESKPVIYPPKPKFHENRLFVSYNSGYVSFNQFKRKG